MSLFKKTLILFFIILFIYLVYIIKWTYFNENSFPIPILSSCAARDIEVKNYSHKFGFVPSWLSCYIKNNITNEIGLSQNLNVEELAKLYSIKEFCQKKFSESDPELKTCHKIYANVFKWVIPRLPIGMYENIANYQYSKLINSRDVFVDEVITPFDYLYQEKRNRWCLNNKKIVCFHEGYLVDSISESSVSFHFINSNIPISNIVLNTSYPFCKIENKLKYHEKYKGYDISYFEEYGAGVFIIDIGIGCIYISPDGSNNINKIKNHLTIQ